MMEYILGGACILILCILSLFAYSRRVQTLSPETSKRLRYLETSAVGKPVQEATHIVKKTFPKFNIKVFDVTRGGQSLQAWFGTRNVIDTVAINHVDGIVDNVALGPGDYEDGGSAVPQQVE